MPYIEHSKEQKVALEFVEERMALLKAISATDIKSPEEVSISLGREGSKGKKAASKIVLNSKDKEYQRVLTIISDYKKRLVREINEKCKKYGIKFNAAERRFLAEMDDASDKDDAAFNEESVPEQEVDMHDEHEYTEVEASEYDGRRSLDFD